MTSPKASATSEFPATRPCSRVATYSLLESKHIRRNNRLWREIAPDTPTLGAGTREAGAGGSLQEAGAEARDLPRNQARLSERRKSR